MNDDIKTGIVTGIIGLLFVAFLMWAIPMWNVWNAGLSGEAKLNKAQQTKLIMVETAKAELEASKIRAEAIKVIGKASKDFPEYRLQEFIGAFADAMSNGNIQKIIYVPTEAQIPILEARSSNP